MSSWGRQVVLEAQQLLTESGFEVELLRSYSDEVSNRGRFVISVNQSEHVIIIARDLIEADNVVSCTMKAWDRFKTAEELVQRIKGGPALLLESIRRRAKLR